MVGFLSACLLLNECIQLLLQSVIIPANLSAWLGFHGHQQTGVHAVLTERDRGTIKRHRAFWVHVVGNKMD